MKSGLNLQAYLERIGLPEPPPANREGLLALHRAHAATIPFENLDIQLGLPIRLDLDHLQAKLVTGRRGGYCFEQNTLFQAVLRSLGFKVEALEARVRLGTTELLPRTHMVLRVKLDEGDCLADVGFGGQGLLHPVPMDGESHQAFSEELRVVPYGPLLVLQTRQALAWQDLYAFAPEARAPIDFEVANWYTSTHPDSRFVKTLTAQLPGPRRRHILRGLSYTVITPETAEERLLEREDLVPLLKEVFGLELPADARFRSLDG
jgi:N-hydroxyarylamine O-acetyltransferase